MTNLTRAGTRRVSTVHSFAAALLAAGAATAQEAPLPEGGVALDLDVIARRLDIARTEIQPRLGATVYDFGRQAIETQPQGDNQSLNQLLLQAPGVRKYAAIAFASGTWPNMEKEPTPAEVTEMARAGDKAAKALVLRTARYLGIG